MRGALRISHPDWRYRLNQDPTFPRRDFFSAFGATTAFLAGAFFTGFAAALVAGFAAGLAAAFTAGFAAGLAGAFGATLLFLTITGLLVLAAICRK